MNRTWLSPILVVIPGVVALLAILYPSYLSPSLVQVGRRPSGTPYPLSTP